MLKFCLTSILCFRLIRTIKKLHLPNRPRYIKTLWNKGVIFIKLFVLCRFQQVKLNLWKVTIRGYTKWQKSKMVVLFIYLWRSLLDYMCFFQKRHQMKHRPMCTHWSQQNKDYFLGNDGGYDSISYILNAFSCWWNTVLQNSVKGKCLIDIKKVINYRFCNCI